ncbi:MAG: helix-turn-helix domain-containing protein [Acidobacteriaceae bacterium]
MNDPERPPLDPIVQEQIRQLLYGVDRQHWPFIAEMRVAKFIPPSIPVPPQLPLQFLHILRTYASVLFKTEADQYQQFRDHRNYSPWLSRLADRTLMRVLESVEKIDQDDSSALLGYHGVTRPEMEKALRDTLTGMVHHYTWIAANPATAPEPPKSDVVLEAHETPDESIGKQIKRLQQECDITAEAIAEYLSVVPRSIYKHLAGQTIPRRKHIAAYERLFSERLNRSVTLQKVSKRSV